MKKLIQWLRDMNEEYSREAKRIAEYKATLDMSGMYRGAAMIVICGSVIITGCLFFSEYSDPLHPTKQDLRQMIEMLDHEAVIYDHIVTHEAAAGKETQ